MSELTNNGQAALTIAIEALTTIKVHMATCVESNAQTAQTLRSIATSTDESIRRVHTRIDEIHEERLAQIQRQNRDTRAMFYGVSCLVITNLVTIGLHFLPQILSK